MRLALVQADLGAPAHVGVRGPVDHEQGAFDAADFPQGRRQARSGRGYAASLRKIWLGRMVPAAMVAATRRMSAQFLSIRSTFTLPPTSDGMTTSSSSRCESIWTFAQREGWRGK